MVSKKDIGYLIGFFIGDGYSNYNKKNRHYNVEFYFNSIRDKGPIVKIKQILFDMDIHFSSRKDKRFNCLKIRVSSKEFMNFVETEKRRIVEMRYVGSINEDYGIGVISGFIDSEGYVNNGEILLTQKDKRTLLAIKSLCDHLSIETRKFFSNKNYRGSGVIWRMRISTKLKYKAHNSYKIQRAYSAVEQGP